MKKRKTRKTRKTRNQEENRRLWHWLRMICPPQTPRPAQLKRQHVLLPPTTARSKPMRCSCVCRRACAMCTPPTLRQQPSHRTRDCTALRSCTAHVCMPARGCFTRRCNSSVIPSMPVAWQCQCAAARDSALQCNRCTAALDCSEAPGVIVTGGHRPCSCRLCCENCLSRTRTLIIQQLFKHSRVC